MKKFIKKYKYLGNKIVIDLEFENMPRTTDVIPGLTSILQDRIPSIFKNECFNPEGLSFYEESQKTEIGHLFEHIILEYMCLTKITFVDEVSFSGRTFWDKKDETGKFRVEISCSKSDWLIFEVALLKSVRLMDVIFLSTQSRVGDGLSIVNATPPNLIPGYSQSSSM